MRKQIVWAAGIFLAGAITMGAACGEDNSSGTGDGPIGAYNDGPSYVLNYPDGFANIALRCVEGVGIYSNTRQSPPVIVQNDPLCAEGGLWDSLKFGQNRNIPVHPNGGDK